MVPESLLYMPLELHLGSLQAKTYAPMMPSPVITTSGLTAYVLTTTYGSQKQGLYVLNGGQWAFAMPQPFLSDVVIRGSRIDIYMGLDNPINVSPEAQVFKNGIVFDSTVLDGPSIFCVVAPQGSGETTVFMKASVDLSGHRVLRATPTGADYASSDDLTNANGVIGISTNAALAGSSVKVQTDGELTEPSWTWAVDQPIFNGINGTLTQVSPSVGYSLIVGVAIEPTRILISVKQPIVLN